MLGQRLTHLSDHVGPVIRPLEVVEDHESALEQVLAQPLGLARLNRPETRLPDVEHRILKDLRIVEIEHVGAVEANADVGDVVDDRAQVLVRGRIVVRPRRAAEPEVAEARAVDEAGEGEITVVLDRLPELRGRATPCAITTRGATTQKNEEARRCDVLTARAVRLSHIHLVRLDAAPAGRRSARTVARFAPRTARISASSRTAPH